MDRLLSEYTEGLIATYVYLKFGYYNPYLWQLRAQARFESKLPFTIEQEMGEYKVQNSLRSLYGPAPGTGTGTPAPLPQRGGQPGDKRGQPGGNAGDNGIERGTKTSPSCCPPDHFFQPCPPECPPIKQKPHSHGGNGVYCRERGIRTPGPVTVSGFQDRRNRPLCQLSKNGEVVK